MPRPISSDVLIIGAGTAGAILAHELSRDPGRQVTLLEAGPADDDPRLTDPAGWPFLIGSEFDWGYVTAPQHALDGRVLAYPRGRVLGGSSAINALGHQRGHPEIFDRWEALGGPGWSFADLLPAFRDLETFDGGADDWRGGAGPLSVIRPRAGERGDFAAAFLEAAIQAGHPLNQDFNGAQMAGAAWNQLAIAGGRRASSATAYLSAARGRPNLTVITGALALGLAFEGTRCVGAEVWASDEAQPFRARQTVLCAGAIDTPRLMMLSGLGDPDTLTRLGLRVKVPSPHVGRHLQDHPLCGIVHAGGRPLPASAYNHGEAIVFAHSAGAGPAPDVQIMAVDVPFSTAETGPGPAGGFSMVPCLMTPESRGAVTLAGTDPRAPAVIDPNYLGEPVDMDRFVAAMRLAREIAAQAALAPWSAGECLPGPGAASDADLRAFARKAVTPFYHPVGTCRMGPEGAGVVDNRLRVHGVEGLGVADASIMPVIPNAMPNAAVAAIALRAARIFAESGG
jgi:choline dehydrogenase